MSVIARLRRTTWEELSWRATASMRHSIERADVRLRPMRWDRRAFASAVRMDLRTAWAADIDAGNWLDVHDRLAGEIGSRPARFALDPSGAAQLKDTVLASWPRAAIDAAQRANRILDGRYDLLGYRGLPCTDAAGNVQWHVDPVHRRSAPKRFWADIDYLDPAIGDHKIIWELNRHQHWLALGRALWLTGDRRYARAIVSQLESWLESNSPLTGVNWASMLEIALRTMSWTWGLHFLLSDAAKPRGAHQPSPWLVDMFVALDRQLTHVERNLSYYFSPNTHLTGEALALYVVGTAIPELAASRRWATLGRKILLTEIARQIGADGGHAERSTHYQRYTLDFYLLALRTARHAGDEHAASRFADAAARLAHFTRDIARDDGVLPLIGDDDGGMLWPFCGRECSDVRDSLAVAATLLDRPELAVWGVPEEVLWVTGSANPKFQIPNPKEIPSPKSRQRSSRVFRDTGYAVLRDGQGGHLVFDVGPHGYMNGGHAHADALAITLAIDGRPLFIDVGTATYTMDARLRDRLRDTRHHNTLTLDGRTQSTPSGPFHWRTRTDGRLQVWRSNPGFDWVEGYHDGYGVRHRRSIVRTARAGWLVVDQVDGDAAQHAAVLHWHFDPRWMIGETGPGRIRATHADGARVWIVHDAQRTHLVHGDAQSGLGWFAPVYGTVVPTWTAMAERVDAAPLSIVSWIGASMEPDADAPSLTRVLDPAPADSSTIAIKLDRGRQQVYTLLAPEDSARSACRPSSLPHCRTDARMLHYVVDDGRLTTVDLADGHEVSPFCEGWVGIRADNRLDDLHVTIEDGALDVWSSTPPPRLEVRGAMTNGTHRIQLNGREVPASSRATRGAITMSSGDWGDIVSSRLLTSHCDDPVFGLKAPC